MSLQVGEGIQYRCGRPPEPGRHGVLAFGPDTEAAVSFLVALEEAAEGELHAAALG